MCLTQTISHVIFSSPLSKAVSKVETHIPHSLSTIRLWRRPTTAVGRRLDFKDFMTRQKPATRGQWLLNGDIKVREKRSQYFHDKF